MTTYEFISNNPWLTIFLACLATHLLGLAITWPFRLVNRWIRHRNIVVAGWPPDYLDADGDFIKKEES